MKMTLSKLVFNNKYKKNVLEGGHQSYLDSNQLGDVFATVVVYRYFNPR